MWLKNVDLKIKHKPSSVPSLPKDKQRLKSPSGDEDAQEMGFSPNADWSEEFGARSRARVRVRLFFRCGHFVLAST